MKTLVHIGQHKTATTSIQNTLAINRSQLLQAGLWYPTELAGINFPSHYPLSVYCLAEGRFSHKKSKLAANDPQQLKVIMTHVVNDIKSQYQMAQANGCHTVLWSNEGLYLLNSLHEYLKLYDLFKQHSEELSVMCCFRDVSSFTKSYTNQLYNSGFQPSEDSDSFCYVKPDSWLFDFERKKMLLNHVFYNKTVVFEYKSSGMVKLFLQKAGFPELELEELRLNQSDNYCP